MRARAGIAIDNLLLFGTAGLAYGELLAMTTRVGFLVANQNHGARETELTGTTSGNLSESHTSLGWVAGLGAEMNFAQHWSAKAEWLYFALGDHQFSVTAANNGLAANLVRLGLNYHF